MPRRERVGSSSRAASIKCDQIKHELIARRVATEIGLWRARSASSQQAANARLLLSITEVQATPTTLAMPGSSNGGDTKPSIMARLGGRVAESEASSQGGGMPPARGQRGQGAQRSRIDTYIPDYADKTSTRHRGEPADDRRPREPRRTNSSGQEPGLVMTVRNNSGRRIDTGRSKNGTTMQVEGVRPAELLAGTGRQSRKRKAQPAKGAGNVVPPQFAELFNQDPAAMAAKLQELIYEIPPIPGSPTQDDAEWMLYANDPQDYAQDYEPALESPKRAKRRGGRKSESPAALFSIAGRARDSTPEEPELSPEEDLGSDVEQYFYERDAEHQYGSDHSMEFEHELIPDPHMDFEAQEPEPLDEDQELQIEYSAPKTHLVYDGKPLPPTRKRWDAAESAPLAPAAVPETAPAPAPAAYIQRSSVAPAPAAPMQRSSVAPAPATVMPKSAATNVLQPPTVSEPYMPVSPSDANSSTLALPLADTASTRALPQTAPRQSVPITPEAPHVGAVSSSPVAIVTEPPWAGHTAPSAPSAPAAPSLPPAPVPMPAETREREMPNDPMPNDPYLDRNARRLRTLPAAVLSPQRNVPFVEDSPVMFHTRHVVPEPDFIGLGSENDRDSTVPPAGIARPASSQSPNIAPPSGAMPVPLAASSAPSSAAAVSLVRSILAPFGETGMPNSDFSKALLPHIRQRTVKWSDVHSIKGSVWKLEEGRAVLEPTEEDLEESFVTGILYYSVLQGLHRDACAAASRESSEPVTVTPIETPRHTNGATVPHTISATTVATVVNEEPAPSIPVPRYEPGPDDPPVKMEIKSS